MHTGIILFVSIQVLDYFEISFSCPKLSLTVINCKSCSWLATLVDASDQPFPVYVMHQIQFLEMLKLSVPKAGSCPNFTYMEYQKKKEKEQRKIKEKKRERHEF